MASRDNRGKRIVVWPSYIDSSEPRSRGRRISLRDSVRRPKIDEILRAAEELGLEAEVVEAAYPRRWWEDRRAVLVSKAGPKHEVLRMLARKIKEIRDRR